MCPDFFYFLESSAASREPWVFEFLLGQKPTTTRKNRRIIIGHFNGQTCNFVVLKSIHINILTSLVKMGDKLRVNFKKNLFL